MIGRGTNFVWSLLNAKTFTNTHIRTTYTISEWVLGESVFFNVLCVCVFFIFVLEVLCMCSLFVFWVSSFVLNLRFEYLVSFFCETGCVWYVWCVCFDLWQPRSRQFRRKLLYTPDPMGHLYTHPPPQTPPPPTQTLNRRPPSSPTTLIYLQYIKKDRAKKKDSRKLSTGKADD